MHAWEENYRTWEEYRFIHGLALRNRRALENYAAIVRSGMRRFDDSVNVDVVLRALDEALSER